MLWNEHRRDVGKAESHSTLLSRLTETTPARLRTALVVGWGLSAALCLFVLVGFTQHERAVKSVGVDAAPSVVAAHKIKIYIETLDADLVNELLGKPGETSDFEKDFEKNRVEIGKQIVAASKNITYGDAEQVPLEKIEASLGGYLMAAQSARDAHTRGDQAAALAAYRRTYEILETELVPGANALNSANDDVLERTYQAQKSESLNTLVFTVLVAGLLVALLVATQIYLVRAFRRLVNPSLAVATVICTAFAGYAAYGFVAHSHDLKGVKQDSYDSVAALLDARADVYEANAAESRWLLDPGMRSTHERTFLTYTAKLATFSGGQTFEGAHAVAEKRNALMVERMKSGDNPIAAGSYARAQHPLDGLEGALRKALDNVTFPDADPTKDEPTQSAETLRTFGIYYGLDAHIRELERSGRHAEAVAFCLGMKPGESNWAFFEFDGALGRWLSINEVWMNRYTDAAFADIAGLKYAAPAVCLFLSVLIFLGLRPRMKEYST